MATSSKPHTHQAVDILKGMILSNELAAGSNHLEGELAALLGMSRTPIREATLILQGQGLVKVKPRHGVKIVPITPADMNEIYDILTELESLSASLAASKNHPAEAFVFAERAIREMDDALGQGNLEAWAEADDQFHTELVRLGGNFRIEKICEMYKDQVKRARFLTLKLRPTPTKSNKDHLDVLNAIKNNDSEHARILHRAHRVQAKEMLVGLLEKFGLLSI